MESFKCVKLKTKDILTAKGDQFPNPGNAHAKKTSMTPTELAMANARMAIFSFVHERRLVSIAQ